MESTETPMLEHAKRTSSASKTRVSIRGTASARLPMTAGENWINRAARKVLAVRRSWGLAGNWTGCRWGGEASYASASAEAKTRTQSNTFHDDCRNARGWYAQILKRLQQNQTPGPHGQKWNVSAH